MNMIELSARMDSQDLRILALETTIATLKGRDRGPKSGREMTEADARNVRFGDLKAASHKDAAKTLGLSYGQVYSAREGFTFKNVKEAA